MNEVADATKNVEAALNRAQQATQAFAQVADSGLEGVETVLSAAQGAVKGLGEAIDKAKASGSPIPLEAVNQLQAFQTVLAGATKSTQENKVATAAAKEEHVLFRAGLPLATRELGPFGSSLRALSQSQNEWVAGLAKTLVPLAAIGGALALADKALQGFRDRGVEVPSFAGAAGAALDTLAIAIGGTSKASQEAIDSFQKAQKSVEDLDRATVSYKSGIDLIVSSGLDLKTTLSGITENANASGKSFDVISEGTISAGRSIGETIDKITQLNQDINVLRLYSPELARQMSSDFAQIGRDVAAGVAGASERLDELGRKARDSAKAQEELSKAIEGTYGKDGPKAFAAFSAGAQEVIARFDALRAAGFTEQQAFAALKGQFDATSAGANQFAGVLAILKDSSLPGTAARIKELEQAHAGLTETIDKNIRKVQEESIEANRLLVVIDANTHSIADRERAVTALLPVINAQIAAIEKQRDAEGNLQASQQIILDRLKALREETGRVQPEMEKLRRTVEDQAISIGNLGKRFEDLTKSYETQRAATIRSADTAIAQAERQRLAVTRSVDKEIIDLESAHQRGEISQSEYADKIAEQNNRVVEARRKAERETTVIQADETSKVDQLAKDYGEATAEIQRVLGRQGETIESARKVHETLAKQAKETSEALVTEANRHSDLARAATKVYGNFDTALKEISKSGGSLDTMRGKLADVEGVLGTIDGKLQSVIGGLKQLDVGGAGSGKDVAQPGTSGAGNGL